MERWRGRVALVTGASEGIGEQVARALVAHGLTVVGCARQYDKLLDIQQSLAGAEGSYVPMKCDVTMETEVVELIERVMVEHGRLDVCVCSAGLLLPASLLSASTDSMRAMLDVNVLGLLTVTREVLRAMRGAGIKDGHVFLLCGTQAHRLSSSGNHVTNFYSATKHMVLSAAQSLRCELRRVKALRRMRVTTVSPGLTRTRLFRHHNTEKAGQGNLNEKQCRRQEDVTDGKVEDQGGKPRVSTGSDSGIAKITDTFNQTVSTHEVKDQCHGTEHIVPASEIVTNESNVNTHKLNQESDESGHRVLTRKGDGSMVVVTDDSSTGAEEDTTGNHPGISSGSFSGSQSEGYKDDDVMGAPPGSVLETEDVSAAILYALSAPPHVDITDILFRAICNN